MILLSILFELAIILQTIWRSVVGNALINISLSIIFLNMILPEMFHQNCKSVLAVVSNNGLNTSNSIEACQIDVLTPVTSQHIYACSSQNHLTISVIGYHSSLTKAIFRKYLIENCSSEHYPQLSLKYFVNLCFSPTLFSKVWKVQTTLDM